MISVIIPNLNDIRIKSAVVKLLPSKAISEILIVDGKSTNQEVLDFYDEIQGSKARILKYEDSGIFDAINHGVSNSIEEIIYLQGTDDVVSDIEVFEDVKLFMSENQKNHGYCMGCKFVDDNQVVKREWMPKSITRNKILLGVLPPHFSLFLRKEVYEVVGEFDVSNKKSKSDLALDSLWLVKMGALIKDLNIFVCNKYWLNMALGGVSTSSNSVIFRQNWKLFLLLKEESWRPKAWVIIPILKVLSKFNQINWLNKINPFSVK